MTTNLVRRPRFTDGAATAVWSIKGGFLAKVAGTDAAGNPMSGLHVTTGNTSGVPNTAPHTEVTLAAGEKVTVWVEGKLFNTAPKMFVGLVSTTGQINPNPTTGNSVEMLFPASSSAYSTVTATITAPASGPYLLRLYNLTTGTFDVTGVRASVMAAPDSLGIFDGDTPDTATTAYAWTAAASSSESTATVVEVTPEPTPDPEPTPEPLPDSPGKRVADFLGQGYNPELVAMADQHILIVTAMAQAYTRGKGFTGGVPADDVAAVITTATARLIANPEQLDIRAGEVSVKGAFTGWTLAETFVLNRYRKTAR
ncbi:hypothetical protein [Arthrobacter sp. H14]|uniref:hypothetical protein n=1 Tax=Arthrobacter sp. H14 TaxID=1312959 RepID=UPI001C1DE3C0|nr:hypothetical protein [Arthrobacter sp. H14]